MITQAMVLAKQTLTEQELLLKMADYLSDNRMMTKELIHQMITKYSRNFDINSIIENGDCLFYRKRLKDKVLTLEETQKKYTGLGKFEFSMNNKISK